MKNVKEKATATSTVNIVISNRELITEFHPAITGLGSLTIKKLDALIAISKAKKTANDLLEEYSELRKKIVEQDCSKDKNGEPIIVGNMYQYPNEEVQVTASKLLKDLESSKISIKLTPISIQELNGVDGITANTIVALREFIKE